MKKLFSLGVILAVQIILLLRLVPTPSAYAANLSPLKDTLSTSRTSPSTVIDTSQAGSLFQVQFKDPVGAFYLSSDSAKIVNNLGVEVDAATIKNVASMSAQNTPSAGKRIVYFTSSIGSTVHGAGEAMYVPITAMHAISMRARILIPVSGKIVITFPALATNDANNPASPSASTFQLNNIAAGQIAIRNITDSSNVTFTAAVTNPTNGTSPVVTLTLTSSIPADKSIVVYLGCSTADNNGCTSSVPRIINPTKSVANGTGDTWRINVKTQDASSVDLESGSTRIATIESVTVQGVIEPTLTFTIAGVASNYNFQTAGCTASEVVNTGTVSTATFVDMGILLNALRITGQTLTVATNTTTGYSITATSSGQFKDASSGEIIGDVNGGTGLTANDTPAPAVMPTGAGAIGFGIFPCGTSVPASYASGATVATTAKGTNPWNTGVNSYYATIATRTGELPSGSETTAVRYAGIVTTSTPAGTYSNAFTYVASPSF